MGWGLKKIKSILPQREPFLFVDEVIKIERGQHITAIKYLDPNEPFFKGHFPGNPIMPGVLTIEAMAQAGILLYSTAKPKIAKTNPKYFLKKAETEFLSPVFPGDTLILDVYRVKILDYVGVISAEARVKDKKVAKMTCFFAVKKNES
jgi:3-hydroxyacyl-[acyl-carrier-protein] dehydratase